MYRRIVIGFDGTEHSRDAVALGVMLARATGASLAFVRAFYDVPDFLPDPTRRGLREQAEHSLRELGLALPDGVVAAKHLVSHRCPARALNELAEETDADLIVLGSSRRAEDGQMTSGRLARQVVDAAPCAVAVAPAGLRRREDSWPGCIGVGVDGSPESGLALVAAGELARAFGARLVAMAAVEPVMPVITQYGHEAEALAYEEAEGKVTHALARAVEAAPGDLEVDQVRLEGKTTPHALSEGAAAAGVDLLVVGARGFGPIRRVLLGSVSAELMHELPCGLMVVPRGAREPDTRPQAAPAGARDAGL